MKDVNVTVVGNMGADPVVRETPGGKVTQLNVGASPRFYDREAGEWRDRDTTWFRVECWSQLGANAAESLRKGERVIVSGRLKVSTWETKEGAERTSVEIVADHVGHDLTFGTSRYSRVIRSTQVPGRDEDGLREGASDPDDTGAAYDVDADGVVVDREEPARV
ncbi:MAG TPA: single-stranded DNA-binding protein [Actinomycetales bacterium]|nr:single-stranded DNA-binding protein [Actinomycetales bacterium]